MLLLTEQLVKQLPACLQGRTLLHGTHANYRWLVKIYWSTEYCRSSTIRLDHSLLKKCKCYGFTPSAVAWIESYLTNRTQKVFFNGRLSNARHIQCGIPQGSSLGPLFFSIFTNDLPLVCKKACVSMYADDSTLYMSAQTVDEITSALNKELQIVSNGSLITSLSWTYLKPRALFLEQNTH